MKNCRAEKERKRQAVVAAKVIGVRTKRAARQIGCSERYVRQLAAEPETRFLIVEVLRPLRPQLIALAPAAIGAIEEALDADKTDEADHANRLRAVDRYFEILEMAQGNVQAEVAPRREMTWEELCALYRARRAKELKGSLLQWSKIAR